MKGSVVQVKVVLLGMLLAVLGFILTWQAEPASADHTRLYFSFPPLGAESCGNPMSPPAEDSTVVLLPNGPTQLACVWVKNQHDDRGVASFQVDFVYDHDLFQVTSVTPETTWLTSTGRDIANCGAQNEELTTDPNGHWYVDAFCTTLLLSPPGPQGGGLIATLQLVGGSDPGNFTITHRNTFLTAVSSALPVPEIPMQLGVATMIVAPCADFAPPPDGDGNVGFADVMRVLTEVGTLNATFDLNGDGSVGFADVMVALHEVTMICPEG